MVIYAGRRFRARLCGSSEVDPDRSCAGKFQMNSIQTTEIHAHSRRPATAAGIVTLHGG
jgi:hypothetical protein